MRNRQRTKMLWISAFLFMSFAGFAIVRSGTASLAMLQDLGQTNSRGKSNARPKEEATIVQEGRINEKQKHHRKLFKHSGRSLLEIAAGQDGEVQVVEGVPFVVVTQKIQRRPVFHSALCNAAAVVVGRIKEKSPHFTEDEKFIFTDYQVIVEEVIKNNAASPLTPSSLITTTRDGGALILNNRTFRATQEGFDPPAVSKRYLLFLRFIPETDSYLMYGNGTFELAAQEVLALGAASRDEISKLGPPDVMSFLSDIRSYASSACHEQ